MAVTVGDQAVMAVAAAVRLIAPVMAALGVQLEPQRGQFRS